ncbi:MAG: hypothetical protein NTY19_21010 [Planctomycetota bacterium]|nr:hypothetical protein [Planctomycetota bacterium]
MDSRFGRAVPSENVTTPDSSTLASAVQRPRLVRPNDWAEYCRMTTVTSLRLSIRTIWY